MIFITTGLFTYAAICLHFCKKKKINIVNDFFSGCSRDMKLLLDLLAATSGIAPCLKLLCMFDRNLRKMTEVSNLTIDSYYNSEKNRTEAVVKFDDAPALKDIFVKIRDVQCIYSVVINPPINKVWMIFFISLHRF